jgi:phospholipid transport system substrate-binding protein
LISVAPAAQHVDIHHKAICPSSERPVGYAQARASVTWVIIGEKHLVMTRSRRGFLTGSLSLALLPSFALAQSGGNPVTAPIEQFSAVLLNVMKAGNSTPFPQRYQMLAPAVDATFDLQRILRISVGSYWAGLPPDQQQRLLQVFRAFIVATYVSNFHSFRNRRIIVFPATRAVGPFQVVTSTINKPNRDPVRIDYVMGQSGGAWRVQDILLDGTISRVAVQRSDFASQLSAGNASRLIATLSQKVSTLSHGTVSS